LCLSVLVRPTSTLFPYATLFRSAHLTTNDEFPDDNTYSTSLSVDSVMSYAPLDANGMPEQMAFFKPATTGQVFQICAYFMDPNRSEEHTSELQSRENLVCRLLLE